ncbi:carbohydrate-binding family 9-like protein [Bryobacter aggregatus]|uniref:carbohydrate-binding family 9-like protein n=1 Tax=Bryobacter aggregatus TaxID=360054 RepID=UPI0004E0FF0E|nr:carbohydrate-binding family 9-like protein [Bryobacter aggregatus]
MKLFTAFVLALTAYAQPPTMEVRRASQKIVVDGKLDDPAWKDAQAVTFQFPWDKQKGAKQKTTARLLWDSQYLYISYDCEDNDLTAHFEKRDDPTYRDDAVEAFINPRPSQTDVYLGLEMNAKATLYDYVYFQSRYLLKRLNLEGVQLATHLRGTLNASGDRDEGWSLEVAIPFTEFEGIGDGKVPQPGDKWALNLNRWDGTEPERRLSQWSNSMLPEPNPHQAKQFGTIVFVTTAPKP